MTYLSLNSASVSIIPMPITSHALILSMSLPFLLHTSCFTFAMISLPLCCSNFLLRSRVLSSPCTLPLHYQGQQQLPKSVPGGSIMNGYALVIKKYLLIYYYPYLKIGEGGLSPHYPPVPLPLITLFVYLFPLCLYTYVYRSRF